MSGDFVKHEGSISADSAVHARPELFDMRPLSIEVMSGTLRS